MSNYANTKEIISAIMRLDPVVSNPSEIYDDPNEWFLLDRAEVIATIEKAPTIEAVPVSAVQDEDFRIASKVRLAVGCNTAKECWELARNGDIQVVNHGHWDNNHCCSVCHKEAFSNLTKMEEIYDYDWDENLVPTGRFEEYYDWFETDFCPNCGAKMDEVKG